MRLNEFNDMQLQHKDAPIYSLKSLSGPSLGPGLRLVNERPVVCASWVCDAWNEGDVSSSGSTVFCFLIELDSGVIFDARFFDVLCFCPFFCCDVFPFVADLAGESSPGWYAVLDRRVLQKKGQLVSRWHHKLQPLVIKNTEDVPHRSAFS